jgi:hypothetical protein
MFSSEEAMVITRLSSEEELAIVQTVADNIKKFTKLEVVKARAARQQSRSLGFITTSAHCDLLRAGDITNTTVTIADVHRAERIWGPEIAMLKGKTKQTKAPPANIEFVNPVVQEAQTLDIDVFFVYGVPFLLGVLIPLSYSMVAELKTRDASDIGAAIDSMISSVKARGFIVEMIRSDNEKGVVSIKQELEDVGIKLERCSPGSHVPIAERKIQFIKSIIRSTQASLAWRMPKVILVFCVIHCTSCSNIQRGGDGKELSAMEVRN